MVETSTFILGWNHCWSRWRSCWNDGIINIQKKSTFCGENIHFGWFRAIEKSSWTSYYALFIGLTENARLHVFQILFQIYLEWFLRHIQSTIGVEIEIIFMWKIRECPNRLIIRIHTRRACPTHQEWFRQISRVRSSAEDNPETIIFDRI